MSLLVRCVRPLRRLSAVFMQCKRGTAAVEFGLTAPVVLLFLVGTIETGRALWTRSTLQYAAEEAARFASVHSAATDAEVVQIARTVSTGLDADSIAVAIVRTTTPPAVSVALTYGFSPGYNLFPTITLRGASRVPALNG